MVFWTYDIRGVYGKDLTPELIHAVGKVLSSKSTKTVVVGRDTRYHGEVLKKALVNGFSNDKIVVDAGMTPTPSIAYYSSEKKITGINVTASHNPIEWNGCKVLLSGLPAPPEFYSWIRDSVKDVDNGKESNPRVVKRDVVSIHQLAVSKLFKHVDVKVVVDFRGGASIAWKNFIIQSFRKVECLNCSVDPLLRVSPEPREDNLADLSRAVKTGGYDFGVAFDGDGDRLVVVDENGEYVSGDLLLALLAKRWKSLVTTYESSMLLEELGYEVIRTRRGDVFYCKEMVERNLPFAGEENGHFCFNNFQPYPDALFSLFHLAKIVEKEGMLSDLLREYPRYHKAIRSFRTKDAKKIIERLKSKYDEHEDVGDGIKLLFNDSWVVIRASQTEPKIRLTVEAKDEQRFKLLLSQFSRVIGG